MTMTCHEVDVDDDRRPRASVLSFVPSLSSRLVFVVSLNLKSTFVERFHCLLCAERKISFIYIVIRVW